MVGVSEDFTLLAECETELQTLLGLGTHAARSQDYYLSRSFAWLLKMSFGNDRITRSRALDILACIAMAALAIAPYRVGLLASAVIGIALFSMWRKRLAAGSAAA